MFRPTRWFRYQELEIVVWLEGLSSQPLPLQRPLSNPEDCFAPPADRP